MTAVIVRRRGLRSDPCKCHGSRTNRPAAPLKISDPCGKFRNRCWPRRHDPRHNRAAVARSHSSRRAVTQALALIPGGIVMKTFPHPAQPKQRHGSAVILLLALAALVVTAACSGRPAAGQSGLLSIAEARGLSPD